MATIPQAWEKLAPWDKTREDEAAFPRSFLRSTLAQPSPAEPRHQSLVNCHNGLYGEDRIIDVIQQLLMWDRALMTSKLRSLEVDINKRFEQVIQSLRRGSSPEDRQEGALMLRVRNLGLDCSGVAIDQRIEDALREQERRLCKRFETMENDLKSRIDKVSKVGNIAASTVLSAVEKMREFDDRMATLEQRVLRGEHQLDVLLNDMKRSRSDLLDIANAFSDRLTQSSTYENADVNVAPMQLAPTAKQAAATKTPQQTHTDTGLDCHSPELLSSSSTMSTASASTSYIETTNCSSSLSSGCNTPIRGQSTVVNSDVVKCDSDMLAYSGIGILTVDSKPDAGCNNGGQKSQTLHDSLECREQICNVFPDRNLFLWPPPAADGLVEGHAKSMGDSLNSTRDQVAIPSASAEPEIGSDSPRNLRTLAINLLKVVESLLVKDAQLKNPKNIFAMWAVLCNLAISTRTRWLEQRTRQ